MYKNVYRSCSTIVKWINKSQDIYIMEHYTTIERNRLLLPATLMQLIDVFVSERSPKQEYML